MLVLSSIVRSVVSIHVLSAVCDATRVTEVLPLTVLLRHTHRLTSYGECTHTRTQMHASYSIVSSSIVVSNTVLVQLYIMAFAVDDHASPQTQHWSQRMVANRDTVLPLGWVHGAEFRLANIDGGDHLYGTV